MQLVLNREYWPGGTNGSLYHNGKILCATTELPAVCFMPAISCLPEGTYELQLVCCAIERQIKLFKIPNSGKLKTGIEAELGTRQLHRSIVLVSEITGEGKGIPSTDACQNLASLIAQALEKGESAYLEIRSYPELALNLTYHQIQWMD